MSYSNNLNELKKICNISSSKDGKDILTFHSLGANTAVLVKFKFSSNVVKSMVEIDNCLNDINTLGPQNLSIEDLNHVLYRCEKEELDITKKLRCNYEAQ